MILTKSKTVFNKCVCTVNLWVAVSSLGNNVCDGIPKLSYLFLFPSYLPNMYELWN
jgi:hypothetical protein